MEEIIYLPITSKATLTNCKNFNVDEKNTLFIASYPKSGTTWMQAIVYQILSNGNTDFGHISQFSPFFEVDRTWENNEIADKYAQNHEKIGWRVFNTHLMWENMPKGRAAKYIYVYRNAMDVCNSFYHHLSNQGDEAGNYTGTYENFVSDWAHNKVPFGTWSNHLKSWSNGGNVNNTLEVIISNHPDILFINYESLLSDPFNNIRSVSTFLNRNTDEETLQQVVNNVSFETMKTNKDQYQPISVTWKNDFQFLRKGIAGDSKNYFTNEMKQELDYMINTSYPDNKPTWLSALCQ